MRTWFITGVSRGFGRLIAEHALKAGDNVVGTARRPEALDDLVAVSEGRLVVLPLEVTDRAAVFEAVEKAAEAFGRIDVVVNNAGFGLMGAVEEVGEEDARAIMETNFFGTLWVTQAALPVLRKQGEGRILQMSSVSGLMAVPTMGLYNASKFALEGLSDALAQEVEGFGIHVTLVEPRIYATDFMGASLKMSPMSPAYDPVRAALMAKYADGVPGDPVKVAEAVLELVGSDAPPRRLLLGDGDFDVIVELHQDRVAEWRSWEPVSRAAG
ncbi:SDR family NAD(P)-dependent oxidoreductase [Amycolatopsis umgeniensis]|uniref:NAD(P)-dependent dehydrogenase (Short-subunit alcohol dehydrogenase family) n=1 Tax=Amycolatopsis umgeniensis TaxID=336628 RepID=A0A841B4A4_9PSEU|nr:SDR family NAD(P)-dependent oxidoreductase [Amycolatopsis umgeniensis]MBB5855859.1 NAD(P)-dependent dehydrogenase (short-subunit alcohol dehydrogenase family) [Amycolatopsis umgeniensis]